MWHSRPVRLCLLLTTASLALVAAQSKSEASASFDREFPVEQVAGRAQFHGAHLGGEAGKPALPLETFTLLLPAGTDPSQVDISWEGGKTETLAGAFDVEPQPAPAVNGREVWPNGSRIKNGRDLGTYTRNAFYPSNGIRHIQAGKLGPYTLVEVQVSPYRYNPVSRTLQRSTGGRLVAKHRNPGLASAQGSTETLLASAQHLRFNTTLQTLVSNYSETIGSYPQKTPSSLAVSTSSPSMYLIITTRAILNGSSSLSAFADSKLKRGYQVAVLTEDALSTRSTGTWTAAGTGWGGGIGNLASDRIRAWLKASWQPRGITDVLLIGNPSPLDGDVPMKLSWPRYQYSEYRETPTDYYYADLSGDWDLNHDGIYGQFSTDFGAGGADKYAEVNVGRIPFYGQLQELDHILDKSIQYENATSYDWRKRALLPMVASDSRTLGYELGEQIRTNSLQPAQWSTTRVYEANYGVNPEVIPCSYDTVLSAWRGSGYGLTAWWTHGWEQGASQVITSENAALLNDAFPSFTFECSCDNSAPEIPTNLSYSLLKNGAIGAVGATRVSWYWMGQDDFTGLTESNASMTYQFARLMAQNESAGKALNDVRARMNLESSSFWMNTIGFNLYGDPSLGIDTHGSDTTTPQPPLVIQADQYSQQSGVQTEPCAEGGNNVGWIDTGDWMVYPIEIPAAGTYTLQYRVASPNNGGILSSDLNAGANQLGTINIPNTGGWQNWTTVSQTVHLPAGPQKFGIYAASGGWNLRWFRIEAQEPATFTAKLFKEPTPWYSEQGLETTTQEPITALSLSLKLAKTPGLSFNGSYASPGELIQRDHTETSTSLIYTFKLAPGAQLPTGTHRFAAQMGLQNTPHPLSGDRWSLTYTAGGQTYNQSGSF